MQIILTPTHVPTAEQAAEMQRRLREEFGDGALTVGVSGKQVIIETGSIKSDPYDWHFDAIDSAFYNDAGVDPGTDFGYGVSISHA